MKSHTADYQVHRDLNSMFYSMGLWCFDKHISLINLYPIYMRMYNPVRIDTNICMMAETIIPIIFKRPNTRMKVVRKGFMIMYYFFYVKIQKKYGIHKYNTLLYRLIRCYFACQSHADMLSCRNAMIRGCYHTEMLSKKDAVMQEYHHAKMPSRRDAVMQKCHRASILSREDAKMPESRNEGILSYSHDSRHKHTWENSNSKLYFCPYIPFGSALTKVTCQVLRTLGKSPRNSVILRQ